MSQKKMFCYQCEQTAKGQGCTIVGVCGKTPEVSTLQDLLVYALRGFSQVTLEAEKAGVETEEADVFTCEALFATLTNVNFDPDDIINYIKKTVELREQLRNETTVAGGKDVSSGPANLTLEKIRKA